MRRRPNFLAAAAALAACCAAAPAHAFTITPIYEVPSDWTTDQQAVVNEAITEWTSDIAFPDGNSQNINVEMYMTDGGEGTYLAEWQFAGSLPVQYPYSFGITDYIAINTFYLSQDSFSLDGPVAGEYDMLTALRHEMGHMLGFAPGVYDNWENEITNGVFDPNGLAIPMAADEAHVNLPDDLMYFSLEPGVSKDISTTDLDMLNVAYGYTITATPEPASLGILGLAGIALLRRRRT